MFADAAGWDRPIRFAGGVGGHMAALHIADQARAHQVARLVFAHIGRPSLRAIDAGRRLPFGEWGKPGRTYRLPSTLTRQRAWQRRGRYFQFPGQARRAGLRRWVCVPRVRVRDAGA